MSDLSITILLAYSFLHGCVIMITDSHLKNTVSQERYKKIRFYWMIPFITVILIPALSSFCTAMPFHFPLQGLGDIILGFDLYYCGSLLLLSLADRIVSRRRKEKLFLIRKLRFWAGILPVAASVILSVYGLVHAQQPVVTHWTVDVSDGASSCGHMRAALLADFHLGPNSRPGLIRKMVELTNAEQPDLILIAGDIFNSTYDGVLAPQVYSHILSGLRAEQGVYAVYGNHDVEEDLFGGFSITPLDDSFRAQEMEQFMADSGITVLQDEVIPLAGGAISLAGRVDGERAGDGTALRMSAESLLHMADPDSSIWVLEHEPFEYEELSAAGTDLVLSGHTHAGQIFPANLFVGFFNDNAYGYKICKGTDTFVTAGVGYYGPPMRIGTDSEVMVIDVAYPLK